MAPHEEKKIPERHADGSKTRTGAQILTVRRKAGEENPQSSIKKDAQGSRSREDEGCTIVRTMGEYYRMYAGVYFGEVNKKTQLQGCKLVVDSGSQFTWVTKKAYEKIFRLEKANPPYLEKKGTFKFCYDSGDKAFHIKGDLYKGVVSFFDSKTSVQNQIFGMVDEEQLSSRSKVILAKLDGEGVIGLGSSALNDSKSLEKYDLDGTRITDRFFTLLDNLKAEDRIPENIVGITIGLPEEGKKEAGRMDGELHLGGRKASAYIEKTMVKIPTVKEKALSGDYAIYLDLKCGDNTIMGISKGIIDSGCKSIYLPAGAMRKYMLKVNSKKKDVVKYHKNSNRYYLAKSNFKYLEDIEFRFFESGRSGQPKGSFKLPPIAQVLPPTLTRDELPNLEGKETVFFAIQDSEEMFFVLGTPWMMWHYVVLDAHKEHKEVEIAEIKDRKRHRWIGL